MGFFTGLDISGSALIAERLRMETISNNLANWRTVREDGQRLRPYRRRTPVFYTGAPGMTGDEGLGVRFAGVAYSDKFIARESEEQPELLHEAPHDTPVKRLDEARAARKPVLRWKGEGETE